MSDDLPPAWPEEWTAPKVTVGDMMRGLRKEVDRIIVTQKELVRTGARRTPDEAMLKTAIALHRAEVFLSACTPYIQQVRALIENLRTRGPR